MDSRAIRGVLCWVITVGRANDVFQIRYHHDGKHNVLGIDGPLEIYGERETVAHHRPCVDLAVLST